MDIIKKNLFEKYDDYIYYYIHKIDRRKCEYAIMELNDIKFKFETIKKLREIYKTRKKRNIKAVMFLALFVLCFELSLLIITDVVGLNPLYAMILGIIGTIFLAYGIYLIIHNPPIYVE
jgi:hypothetical protein